MDKASIAVLIPCFNVSTTLENFFKRLTPEITKGVMEFVFLDNASEDDTLEKIRVLGRELQHLGAMITIFSNRKNYGYGGNIKIGFDYCLSRDFRYIIILHGDDQGNSDTLLSQFIKMVKNSSPDLILASRFGHGANISKYNKLRTIGNIIFNRITHFITGIRMSDAGSGIICIKATLLKETPYRSLTNGFQFHPQLNLFFYVRKDIRIQEIPMEWSDSLAPSSIKLVRYATTLFLQLIIYRFRRILGRSPDLYFFDSRTETDLQTIRIELKTTQS